MNHLGQSGSSDDGSYQHNDWRADSQTKPVEYAIHSIDHGFVPEVVLIHVLPQGNPLRAHVEETCNLVLRHDDNS